MEVNIKFLIIAYIVGMAVDWILQFESQAVNKSKWYKGCNWKLSLSALLTHSFIYAGFTEVLTYYLGCFKATSSCIIVVSVLFITHAIIDTRIPVKKIMKFKGMSEEQINDHVNFGFMHIGIDQRLHEIVLLILALFI